MRLGKVAGIERGLLSGNALCKSELLSAFLFAWYVLSELFALGSHRQRVLDDVDTRSYTRGRGIGHAQCPFLLCMLHLSHLGGLFGELFLAHIDGKLFALMV